MVKGPMEGRFLSFLLVLLATLESARQTRKRKNKPEPSIKRWGDLLGRRGFQSSVLNLLSVRPLKSR